MRRNVLLILLGTRHGHFCFFRLDCDSRGFSLMEIVMVVVFFLALDDFFFFNFGARTLPESGPSDTGVFRVKTKLSKKIAFRFHRNDP